MPGPSEAELRQLMTQFPMLQDPNSGDGQLGADDPMMALLQQMGLPAGGMGGMRGMPGMQEVQQQERNEKWDPWWKLLHVLGALFLASLTLRETGVGSGFRGSVLERFTSEADQHRSVRTLQSSLFYKHEQRGYAEANNPIFIII